MCREAASVPPQTSEVLREDPSLHYSVDGAMYLALALLPASRDVRQAPTGGHHLLGPVH